MENTKEYFFVYGSLKRGFGNNRLLSESPTAKFIKETKTDKKYKMISLGSFPGVIEADDINSVNIQGELWSVEDQQTKMNIDTLEGYNKDYPEKSFYFKRIIEIEGVKAYIYIFNHKTYGNYNNFTIKNNIVENGTW